MASDKLTVTQLSVPVCLTAFVVVIFLAFQSSLLMNDRGSLQQARSQQDKPLEQTAKIKEQTNALAIGTLKLAESGNKDAQNIINELKKLGITVQEPAPAAPSIPAPPSAPAP